MKTFDGYKKQALTDVYALLAGGGHKPLSEFSMAHSHPYLPLAGGTMTGALNFKNDIWNLMGDNAYIGDCNVAGMIGVKGANAATPGFALYNNSETLLGKLYASGGTLIWSGGTIQATTFNGNAVSATNADTVDGVHVNQLCRIYTFNVHNSIIKVGTLTSGQYGHVCKLRFNSGIGYNAVNQDKTMTVVIRASNGNANSNGFYFESHSESYRGGAFTTFYLHQTSQTQCELYMDAFNYSGQSTYEVSFSAGDSWTNELSVQNALPTSNIFTLPNYQIAYTDYNVASATKLQTPRTIWGQSFDGTNNISGTLSGVAHIQFSADYTYNIGSNSAASKYIYTYWLGAKSGLKLELGANNSNFGLGLCIDTNLNVGIGTNTPAYKLDVVGNIRATGQIIREALDLTWVNGRRGALLRETTSTGYHTLWSLKTTNGSWDFGEYNSSGWNNIPVLSYITDTNFNSGNNTTTYQIKFPLDSGTIALTKNIPTTLPANGGNADTTDGVHITWAGELTSTSHLVAWEANGSALRDINPANVTVGNSDKVDGYHANGLLTALSNSNNGISITVGGTTKSISNISVNYANSAGNADTLDNTHLNGIFTAFGNNSHNITATIGGVTKSFLVNWAADSDKLDGYHASNLLTSVTNTNNGISVTVGGTTKSVSNISVNYANSAGNADTALYLRSLGNLNCQTGRTLNYGDVYTYNTYDGNTGSPTTFTSVIGFGRGIAGTVEIAGGWDNTNLYWRSLRDCCEDWHSWRTVLDSSNYTEYINNYYWANVKISTSSSTTTSPTVHTLTATRVCAGHNPEIDNSISCSNWFRSSGDTGWYNTTYRGGWYMSDTSWIRAHNGVGIYTSGQIYSPSSIRMGNIYLLNTDEINNGTNGSIHLNYRNSGNISLCYGGGKVGIGTTSPTYKLDVNGDIHSSGTINCNALKVDSTLSIKDSVISCSAGDISILSKESGSLLINSREVLHYDSDFIYMNNRIDLLHGLCFRTSTLDTTYSIYTTDDVTVLIGVLRDSSTFKFRPAKDGLLLFLKIGKLYSDTYFWCTAENCVVIRAKDFGIYLDKNQNKDCFGDGLARIFIYIEASNRWYEFYCG